MHIATHGDNERTKTTNVGRYVHFKLHSTKHVYFISHSNTPPLHFAPFLASFSLSLSLSVSLPSWLGFGRRRQTQRNLLESNNVPLIPNRTKRCTWTWAQPMAPASHKPVCSILLSCCCCCCETIDRSVPFGRIRSHKMSHQIPINVGVILLRAGDSARCV